MRSPLPARWFLILAVGCGLAWSGRTTAIASLAVSWQQRPASAAVIACDQSTTECPAVPRLGGGAWLNGVVLDEVLSNQADPRGLGAYQIHVRYDPAIFQQPGLADAGVLADGGVRSAVCGEILLHPGDVIFDCYSIGPYGIGANWTGGRVLAQLTFVLQPGVYTLLHSVAQPGLTTTVAAVAVVTNTCGQPLNDGSAQPIAGQDDCQGNLLPGVQPGGTLPDANPVALTIDLGADPATALVGDVNGDCIVNLSDLVLVASRYLTAVGSILYSPLYDLNHDGVINILDIQIVAAHYGQHC